ncbi:hypothetical protein ACFY8B_32805 [Streptomyces sp. NPDC012751]|uniref:hypothetical protein n=1 Tax=Streptomyces sp. NPDC012751 TaxID=3364846 RepID=UPI003689BEA9
MDLDRAAGLQAAHRPPHGGTLGIARRFGAVDDAREPGDGGGQRGTVDTAAPAGLAEDVRQLGPLHTPLPP